MKLVHAVAVALSLPEVHEEPHFDMPSFRVGRKIFATVPPGDAHLHVFVDAGDVRAAIERSPAAFEELRWGKQLAGVRVVLAGADPDVVRELLEKAWRRRAPKRVVARFDAERGHDA